MSESRATTHPTEVGVFLPILSVEGASVKRRTSRHGLGREAERVKLAFSLMPGG